MSQTKISDVLRSSQQSLAIRRVLVSLALCAGVVPFAYAQESSEAEAQDETGAFEAPSASVDEAYETVGAEGDSAEAGQASQQAMESPAQVDPDVGASENVIAAPEAVETIAVDPVLEPEVLVSNSSDESSPTQLDEIMVTATKRNQSVRDIPSTINVLSGEKLEAQGARELQDFVDQIPGLQIQDAAVTSSRKIVIRGIAPDNVGNQTVGTLLGDVPMNDPIGSYTVVDPDTWDLETFEVLKGPQGTLFGAASLAGIIRYVPKAPELQMWQAKLAAEYMSVKEGGAAPTYSAAINVPVGDTLALRLSGVHETRPGVIDIDTPNRQVKDADEARKWAGRAMLFWEPNDRLSVNAWYMAQQRESDEQFFATNWDAEYTRRDAPGSSPSKRYFDMAVLDARYRFDGATLVSLSSVQNKENIFNIETSYILAAPLAEQGISVGRSRRDALAKGFMQELRLVSPDDGPWLWQAGAFFSDFEADVYSDIYLTDPVTSQLLLLTVPLGLREGAISENGVSVGNARLNPLGATETALFGEVTYQFDTVNVTLGARLYETETVGTSTVSGIAPLAATGQPVTVENLSVTDDGISPKLAVAWQLTDDMLAYGSVSRGFQYGGVNNRAVPSPGSTSPRTYKSSTLWSYEAGLRTDWFDRSLRADVTAFFLDWTDAQVSQQIFPADFYLDNVGKVEVKGVEASLRYFVPFIEGLSLDATGGYLDARTAEAFTSSSGDEVPEGSLMPNSPKIQYSATLNYARAIGGVWATNVGLQFSHVGKSVANLEQNGRIEARNMLNVNYTVSRPDLSYAPSLGLVINNLTDERKITSASEDPEVYEDPTRVAENFGVGYTRPRTIILRLSASFQ